MEKFLFYYCNQDKNNKKNDKKLIQSYSPGNIFFGLSNQPQRLLHSFCATLADEDKARGHTSLFSSTSYFHIHLALLRFMLIQPQHLVDNTQHPRQLANFAEIAKLTQENNWRQGRFQLNPADITPRR